MLSNYSNAWLADIIFINKMMLKQYSKNAANRLITGLPQFGLRIRVGREINYAFENERKAYKKELGKYRTIHTEEFWNT